MENTTLTTLVAARKLLSDRSKWTQNVFARNNEGREVDWRHPSACCWCVMGALKKVAPRDKYISALRALCDATNGASVANTNDTKGYIAAMDLLDKAIKQQYN
jgi:beta-galactosidase/beta-glucuronidase